MLGRRVTSATWPWTIGGRVEVQHTNHHDCYGIRGRDGHLYWQWRCDFKCVVSDDLFGALG